jgi:hypothetical protein
MDDDNDNDVTTVWMTGDGRFYFLCKFVPLPLHPEYQWRTEGGVWGVQTPPPEIPKFCQS